MSVAIPSKLADACRKSAERTLWLNRLPGVLEHLQQRWSLTLGPPFDTDEVSCAWVAPVKLQDETAAILKLGMPHMEGLHEIQGLRFWSGDPTVLLLESDDDLGAMLLESCEPGTHLRDVPEPEQDVVISGLLRRLWRAPSQPHPFRPLGAMIEYWCSDAINEAEHWPDRPLVLDALQLISDLSQPSASDVLLATDLHAGNVLRAGREPWLVIDPKPFLGDPAYDATQHLLNCYQRLCSDPIGTIRRFADLLQLDSERVRLWTFARAALQAATSWQTDRWLNLARAAVRNK